MKLYAIAEGLSLAATGAGAAVELNATPFVQGRGAVLMVDVRGVSGSPTLRVQGSDDGTTWTDLVVHTGNPPAKMAQVTIPKFLRYNVTAAGTAGTANVYLLGSA